MKRHLKRQEIPKNWPIKRKGSKYVVRPTSGLENGIPLLIALRELLGVAKNRKEVKQAIHQRKILLNGKKICDEKRIISLFDVVKIIPSGKSYRLTISQGGKFLLEEISEKEEETKTLEVTEKGEKLKARPDDK